MTGDEADSSADLGMTDADSSGDVGMAGGEVFEVVGASEYEAVLRLSDGKLSSRALCRCD